MSSFADKSLAKEIEEGTRARTTTPQRRNTEPEQNPNETSAELSQSLTNIDAHVSRFLFHPYPLTGLLLMNLAELSFGLLGSASPCLPATNEQESPTTLWPYSYSENTSISNCPLPEKNVLNITMLRSGGMFNPHPQPCKASSTQTFFIASVHYFSAISQSQFRDKSNLEMMVFKYT